MPDTGMNGEDLQDVLAEARAFIHEAQYRTMDSRRRAMAMVDRIDAALGSEPVLPPAEWAKEQRMMDEHEARREHI